MAKSKRKRVPKTVLKLPDLEQSKSAVLNSLTSSSSKRSYDHAIREFIDWYCSEPRLAFNRTVVTRYRIALEQHPYAPSTINLRLAAIRRLAYEASDCGLLSPDLAAGIRRVKGVRRPGVTLGTPRSCRLVLFDLDVSVPVVEYVFNLVVLDAPGQMIFKADTYLCIIKGLCRSKTARNYVNCRPFLAFQTLD